MWKPLLLSPGEVRDLLLSLIPMSAAVYLMFSTTTLLSLFQVRQDGEWPLFYSLVLAAPAVSYLSHLLPTHWLLLAGAGLIETGVTAALLHRGSGHLFIITTGIGIAVLFHAANVSLSHCCKRQSLTAYCFMLAVLWVVIVNAAYVTDFVYSVTEGMLLVGGVTIFTCAVPAGLMMKLFFTSQTLNKFGQPQAKSSFSVNDKVSSQLTRAAVSKQSITHLITWLLLFAWWALGVNMTRMNITTPNDEVRILSLQGAFILTGICIRLIIAFRFKAKNDLSWNYMSCNQFLVLGLTGMAGLSIVIYPPYTDPYPCHLLFAIAFFIQITDIADLLINAQHTGSKMSSSAADLPILQILMVRRGVLYVLCQLLMLLLSAFMFIWIVKPFTSSVFKMVMTMDLSIAQDVACLGVLSLAAICISFIVRPGGLGTSGGPAVMESTRNKHGSETAHSGI